jgi:hypothetical protein
LVKFSGAFLSFPLGHGKMEAVETAMPWKVENFRHMENAFSL